MNPPDRTVIVKFRIHPDDYARLAANAPTGISVGPYARSLLLDALNALPAPEPAESKGTP